MPSGQRSKSYLLWLGAVLGAFLFSRIVYFLMGVRFDATPITYYRQYADPELLRTHLLQTVYYLHSQPPLFNLFLGIVLKLFPSHYPAAFAAIYFMLGLVFTLTIFHLLRRVGVSNAVSAGLTVIFIVNPGLVLFENWLFYTYPLAVLLSLCALFLHRFLSRETMKDAVVFFGLLGAVVLSRGVFHLFWFIAVSLLIFAIKRTARNKILVACLIPFAIVVAAYVKNYVVFHVMSMGEIYAKQNLADVAVESVPKEMLKELVDRGDIVLISKVPTFSPVSSYKKYITPLQTGIPVLDQEIKSTKANNFQNLAYLQIADLYFKDALVIIKSHPKLFLQKLVRNYREWYFRPFADVWPFNNNNRNHGQLCALEIKYNMMVYGKFGKDNAGLFLLFGLPILMIYLIVRMPFAFFRKPSDLTLGTTLLFMFMTMTMTHVAILCAWEHNRIRFMIDSYYLALLGLLIRNRFLRLFR